MSELTKFDNYLSADGPAALVIREWLMPAEGADGVLFPATFAPGGNFPGGYNIDTDPSGKNVCLIDSVGSQANRIEPMFMPDKCDGKYAHLVPQIVVKAGEKEVSILEAGHRAGDAIVRCSSLQRELHDAFNDVLKGDATKLAKIAPTSLVFGVWDSRDTQAKLPRVVASTVRAEQVRPLTRGAVYMPPVDYAALEVFSEEEKAKAEGDNKSPLAKRGFVHVPASASHGGVIADGGVRRDATLGLAALRLLHAGKDPARTLALRRYILGLALVAFTHNPSGYLRQGCLLVLDSDKPREFVEVHPSGERKPVTITPKVALEYATASAKEFGVGDSRTVPFEKERAKTDLKEGNKKTKGKAKKSKEKSAEETPEQEAQ
ncbi:CRISPR-associated protein (Cas_GSU0053) [Gemmata obscuriglobus]|uniref:Type I-U CRISPR-associated protein Cas7 n=1 Tax=Gemmata obscuriglobus TaxID=114 RepID=A0A2Z3H1R5_9BACT|nr:type I-U CRISPR-associated RAMP protein Csb1/Cas7u [Gemmata obscuriglobus]AWM35564.1 type I-U CRISPR-associated protein Cas7 [Gemmata obscuriglobus]QEG31917.1 CRISPR-associated protein (Cas_GSU0053) [Gemmata obscuriglobus]VTS11263.1 CRISPR-associated protein, GSU0053 family OS=Planctomyces limnophilus (strain ATCC 43296 / DSM 3776 / IFAM 1008 / 290) GN=Plim_3149 PE=4 SV=1: Cas_GSU0053 [Gemmata obscuriglobus UQM 2246]